MPTMCAQANMEILHYLASMDRHLPSAVFYETHTPSHRLNSLFVIGEFHIC